MMNKGNTRLVSLSVTSKRVVAAFAPHVATTLFDYGQGKADVTEVLTAVATEL